MLDEDKEVWLRAYCSAMIGNIGSNNGIFAQKANTALDDFKKKFPEKPESSYRESAK